MKPVAVLRAMGWDPRLTWRALRGVRRYVRDAQRYSSLHGHLSLRDAFPILHEFTSEAGTAKGHYFHQDLWAARLIFERRPPTHLDIGSRIDGFVAHLLTFMPVTVMDVRPLTTEVPRLSFIQGDATTVSGVADNSVDSLSSLHAIEHFGLGRYGDAIDPGAPSRTIRSLVRVLAPRGRLYLSVPIGKPRVQFNAHRIFDPTLVIEECGLPLVSFAAVDDTGALQVAASPHHYRDASYSCGLYEFTKD